MDVRSILGRSGLMHRGSRRVARIERTEGPRGYSLRASVYMRHVAYFFIIAFCSAISNFCFQHIGSYAIGGKLMFALASLVMIAAAAGTMFYSNQREEIIEQTRRFVFGLMLLPGTCLALIAWAATALADGSTTANSDQFIHVLLIGLPMLYFGSVVLPPVLFVKMLTGMHTLHRSRLDNEEMVQIYSRQDGRQQ